VTLSRSFRAAAENPCSLRGAAGGCKLPCKIRRIWARRGGLRADGNRAVRIPAKKCGFSSSGFWLLASEFWLLYTGAGGFPAFTLNLEFS